MHTYTDGNIHKITCRLRRAYACVLEVQNKPHEIAEKPLCARPSVTHRHSAISVQNNNILLAFTVFALLENVVTKTVTFLFILWRRRMVGLRPNIYPGFKYLTKKCY